MTRILADLPDEEIKWLDQIAAEQGKSRAAVLREAVVAYKPETSGNDTNWIDQGFGLWPQHGVKYDRQRQVYLDTIAAKYPEVTLNEASHT
jgi:Ribbon-helix-helix protein, copG family